jgi:hypothetical protein
MGQSQERSASAADQDLAVWLGRLQDASYSRASEALRTAYPPPRRMTGPQLAGYLERRTYALASTTRPDGRAHAAPTLFSLYADAFWLPTLSGAARLGNVRAQPWLALSILEGEARHPCGGAHRGPGRSGCDPSRRCPQDHRKAEPRRQPGLGNRLAADDPAAALQLRRGRLAGRSRYLMKHSDPYAGTGLDEHSRLDNFT